MLVISGCSYSTGGAAHFTIHCVVSRSKLAEVLPFAGGQRAFPFMSFRKACSIIVRASTMDSYESSSEFVKRTEQAWLISQQPRPVACSSCQSKGHIECKWCGGTGFFILGNNMLCEVPSRNTSCIICAGKGSASCPDCKGTGFRAKWLGEPPPQ